MGKTIALLDMAQNLLALDRDLTIYAVEPWTPCRNSRGARRQTRLFNGPERGHDIFYRGVYRPGFPGGMGEGRQTRARDMRASDPLHHLRCIDGAGRGGGLESSYALLGSNNK